MIQLTRRCTTDLYIDFSYLVVMGFVPRAYLPPGSLADGWVRFNGFPGTSVRRLKRSPAAFQMNSVLHT